MEVKHKIFLFGLFVATQLLAQGSNTAPNPKNNMESSETTIAQPDMDEPVLGLLRQHGKVPSADEDERKLDKWSGKSFSVTCADGSSRAVTGYCSERGDVILPHPNALGKFWIGGRDVPSKPYFLDSGDEMFAFYLEKRVLRMEKSSTLESFPDFQPTAGYLKKMVRGLPVHFPVSPRLRTSSSSGMTRFKALSERFGEIYFGEEIVENKDVQLENGKTNGFLFGTIALGYMHGVCVKLNIVSIIPEGDLWRFDFAQDYESSDYSGGAGSLWIDLKNKRAVKARAWIDDSKLARKRTEEKLKQLKIKRENEGTNTKAAE